MVSWAISFRATIRRVARLSLLLGIFLFIKVVTEDIVNGIAGFRSLDLSERVVREKTGSGLVVMCSILQLEALALPEGPTPSQRKGFPKFVDFGEVNFFFFADSFISYVTFGSILDVDNYYYFFLGNLMLRIKTT